MKTFHTCFAMEQIFVNLDGSIRACCVAQKSLKAEAGNMQQLFAEKFRVNDMIADSNDAAECWKGCPVRYPISRRPATRRIRKIVVYTNTFCPLTCKYCSLAYTPESPEWEGPTRPGMEGNSVWHEKATDGVFLPPVRVHKNNTPGLVETLRNLTDGLGTTGGALQIEFTGGDSAYHPEFLEALDFLAGLGIRAIYLSSGVLPPKSIPQVLRHVKSGMLEVVVSPDAIQPETWAAIKRRPARLFDQVLDFLASAARVQPRNQVAAKFIVLPENLLEAPVFTQFYAALGVRRFVLSEYRPQPAYFTPPATETQLADVCANVWHVFTHAALPSDSELVVIGLERFFGDQSCFSRHTAPVRPAAALAIS